MFMYVIVGVARLLHKGGGCAKGLGMEELMVATFGRGGGERFISTDTTSRTPIIEFRGSQKESGIGGGGEIFKGKKRKPLRS